MPELAEVETIKNVLAPQLCGRTVTEIVVERPEVIAHPEAELFTESILGTVITTLQRRGKYLMISLQNGGTLVIHLRMTGELFVTPKDYLLKKHTHVIIRLDNETELRFIDMRRFGRLWYLRKGETDTYTGISTLGPEPFDEQLTAAYLEGKAGKSKKAIKDWLLCQQFIAGIGNIYSDEILFAAGIDPRREAKSLKKTEWKRLVQTIPQTMRFFVEKNEISAEDYLREGGEDYRNTPFLRVYGHAGEPCTRCHRPLSGCRVAGRSSVYCPCCQK